MSKHQARKHSKFSASGAERWFNCPGSVALSEGMPDKDSPWAKEGTEAHEVLETVLTQAIEYGQVIKVSFMNKPKEMIRHAHDAANFMYGLYLRRPNSEIQVETRIPLDIVHPEAFGTFDGAVIDWFETLHVFDYKYGAGHAVNPKENLQMIFYALGLAARYYWNFKRVRLWIIQPRIRGYDGPVFWDVHMSILKGIYLQQFKEAVARVEENPDEYVKGSWCHWCKAKSKCPLQRDAKNEKAVDIFSSSPFIEDETIFGNEGVNDGKEEKGKEDESETQSFKSEADWKKEARKKKRGKACGKDKAKSKARSGRQRSNSGDDFY